ncbi:MAG TPA: cyclase family protein [Candidatus Saccharimonadales bacterium]|nr:cyclase family protein [Candidatus Saccharimonadales bacterium]
MPYIDLSVPITNGLPVYPGDPEPRVEPVAKYASEGYNDHELRLGTHAGTHVDAPYHMVDHGKTLDQYPVEQFVGRGRYIKVDGAFSLAAVQAAGVQAGDIVIFDTGMARAYGEADYFEKFPHMPEDVARYLVAQKVKMVGADTCSPDAPPFVVHKLLLDGDVLIIENLMNVSELAGKEFTVYALPIKLQVDGAPARVVAEIR